MKARKFQSLDIRRNAAELANSRFHPDHRSNGDEHRFRFEHIADTADPRHGKAPSYVANFTKCLPAR